MPKQAGITLTRTTIEDAKPVAGRTITLTDRRLAGFQCLVGTQSKTFYFVGYVKGKAVRVKIGQYPQFQPEEARMKAEELRRMFARGIDPLRFKGRHMSGVLEEYIEKRQARNKMRDETADEYRRILKTTCARFAMRDVDSITDDEVEHFTDGLNKKGHAANANHVLTLFGIVRKHLKLPSYRISRYDVKKRVLPFDDWAAWRDAVEAAPRLLRNVYLFAVYTGLRRESVMTLRWEQIKNGHMHFAQMKHQRDVVLPIPTRCLAILDEQKQESPYVFPSPKNPNKPSVKTEFDGRLGTMHDCRRMFTEAGRDAMLPDYIIAQLRADADRTMRDRYTTSVPKLEWVDRIGEELEKRFCR